MSDEKYQFDLGVKRGAEARSEKYGVLETELTVSREGRAARTRGYEVGSQALATAKAIAASVPSASQTSNTDGPDIRLKTPWLRAHEDGLLIASIGVFWLIFAVIIFRWFDRPNSTGFAVFTGAWMGLIPGAIVGFFLVHFIDFVLDNWIGFAIGAAALFAFVLYLERVGAPIESQTIRGMLDLPADGTWSRPVDVPLTARCISVTGIPRESVQVKELGSQTWQPWNAVTEKVARGEQFTVAQFRARRSGSTKQTYFIVRPVDDC